MSLSCPSLVLKDFLRSAWVLPQKSHHMYYKLIFFLEIDHCAPMHPMTKSSPPLSINYLTWHQPHISLCLYNMFPYIYPSTSTSQAQLRVCM